MIEVRLPQLAEDVAESLMVLWFVSEGDFVEKGQPLVEVQTEKAVSEIAAESNGTIQKISVNRGDTAKVGEVLATIDPDGVPGSQAAVQDQPPASEPAVDSASAGAGTSNFVRVSPRLRRLAKDLGVNLDSVKGTGPQGSITEENIRDEAGL